MGVGVIVGLGVGVGGQLYGSKTSHPIESIILTISELAPSKGDGTSNVNVGGIVVDPVTK